MSSQNSKLNNFKPPPFGYQFISLAATLTTVGINENCSLRASCFILTCIRGKGLRYLITTPCALLKANSFGSQLVTVALYSLIWEFVQNTYWGSHQMKECHILENHLHALSTLFELVHSFPKVIISAMWGWGTRTTSIIIPIALPITIRITWGTPSLRWGWLLSLLI